jgi:hypothetical protein
MAFGVQARVHDAPGRLGSLPDPRQSMNRQCGADTSSAVLRVDRDTSEVETARFVDALVG